MHTAPDISAQHWLSISLLGLIWGSTFLVIEIALQGITPLWLAACRISIGRVMLVARGEEEALSCCSRSLSAN